jgi:tRNA A-37 threonylcarbamoyl transferase component Bud32
MSIDYRLDKYYDDADNDLSDEIADQLTSNERYKELTKIATGGMKTIYKAFDGKSQRYIAYATLNNNVPDGTKDTFIKEARLTAKLNHPNIIPIYNIGLNEENIPFFTMELKTGDSLKAIIQKLTNKDNAYAAKYTLRERLGIFIKVCDAIDFAHSKKVIHLDIKPDNIQVGNYGEVIVCDWGLSKVYDQQFNTVDLNQLLLSSESLNTETLHGQIKGSPGFMAPEQINTGGKKTPKTDVFSLGCLLYTLLGLKAPFRGKSLQKVLDTTVAGEYESLVNIPQSLQAVIVKAMATNPEERYDSVSSLKSEIESFLTGYATEAEGASSFKLLKLFIMRNKALSLTAFTASIIMILGTLIFIQNIKAEKDRAEDNLRLFKAQKAETNKAQQDYYQALIDNNNSIFHSNYLDAPIANHRRTIKGLLSLITAFPNLNEAKSALAYHYFVAQKFNQSAKILQEAPGIYKYMLPHALKYKGQKEDNELLSPELFTQLLSEIQPYKILHIKMLMYYSENRKNPQDAVPAVKHLLTRLNPEWDPKNFTYLPKTARLTISGKNFNKLCLNYREGSPIRALKIKALTLRQTNIENIKPLANIPMRALDISNTKISFLNLKKDLPMALLRLIIHEKQFTKKQLSQLPGITEIKYSNPKE